MKGQTHSGQLALSTGITLPYLSVGPGEAPPVLLLHAWAESRRAFDPLVAALPIIDAADLPPVVLFGTSSGGYVAQQVAVTHPENVAGLVLAGSPRTLQGRPPFATEVEQLRDPVPESWVRDSLAWFPLIQPVPRSYVDDRVRDGVRTPAHVWRETFRGLCTAVPPTDAGTITCPTLIVCGDSDELLGEQQQDLARAISPSRLVAYEETGHLVLWERPVRLAHDLAAFVQSLAP